MKAKEGRRFTKWLRCMVAMDDRLTLSDYDDLLGLYKRSHA